ncbi:MAG: hypothetical protein R3F39_01950 [Myxococcota bacterium]
MSSEPALHAPQRKGAWPRSVGRVLGWLVVALWVLPYCAHTREPRTIVTASGEIIRVHDRNFNCDGGLTETQIQRQLGGGVTVVHEFAKGVQVGGSIEGVRGEALESISTTPEEGIVPDRSPYFIASAGAQVGYTGRWFSVDGGGRMYMATDSRLSAVPWIHARGGRIGRIWGEMGAGPARGAFDPTFFGAGIGFEHEIFRGSAGFAFGARRMVDQFDRDERGPWLASYAENRALDTTGYLDLRLQATEVVGVGVYAVLGRASSARLTLSFSIPDGAGDDAAPSAREAEDQGADQR